MLRHPQLEAFGQKATTQVGRVKKAAALDVWRRVTMANPVDTGRSRAAWNIAINTADMSVPPEGRNHSTPTVPAIGEVRPGEPVIVSNNVPYIAALERGHSQRQAPSGFVAAAVNATQQFLDNLVRQIKE